MKFLKKMNKEITNEKLDKYFKVTGDALNEVKKALNLKEIEKAKDFLDMATRYYEDAKYFKEKQDYVLAFGALNYAHGWLDAGARIQIFQVNNSKLFTVDDK